MAKREYYIDPRGDRVPVRHVKKYDKKRDRIAQRIASDWQKAQDHLRKCKAHTMELIAELQDAAADAAGVPELGGKLGNLQFRSFDGNITVALDCQRKTEFDERLAIAQELIMEAVAEMGAKAEVADLAEIARRTFTPRSSGNLDRQRIRDLRNYNVKHPKWKQACEIISECERTIGHREYVRVSVRKDRTSKPKSIVLDIASL